MITAQKMKFSINDFFSKCDKARSFLWIWSHLLKKSLMDNFIFCTVDTAYEPLSSADLVIYLAVLFWDGISSLCIARFCVWFVVSTVLRMVGVIFNGSMLLMVYLYFSMLMTTVFC